MAAIIERATIMDSAEILALQKLAYRSEAEIYNDFNIPPLVQTLEEMEKDFGNQTFLKATVDGRIIGAVRAHGKGVTCCIGRLIVHPDFQNQGIGRGLMKEIERNFNTSERFELFTGERSEKNLRFYHRLGYRRFKTGRVSDRTPLVFLEKRNVDR